ncbi:RNA polymerase sigma factor [Halobacillus litoralis]|uniref:RNA polymerase sigma factor n=1 Tax=Halobacillus litoralis TaxID=45668 RepID=UPI001CFD81CE|nr:RNA polymerase sigma factor [Halobacillus litoralis]WLR47419.1 RNA polymerase sigma factor [Halobacillus litoralis]
MKIHKDLVTKLYRYCLTLTSDPHQAEDLVQETILRLYQKQKDDDCADHSFSYVKTTAKHLWIDEKRKEKPSFPFDELIHHPQEDFMEYDSLIELLVAVLPLKQAMLLTLKDVFHYSSKEISTMLRMSDAAVKTTLHRTRKQLTIIDPLKTETHATGSAVQKFANALKKQHPEKIFYYYRLLESANYQMKSDQKNFYVVDPSGNLLEITRS